MRRESASSVLEVLVALVLLVPTLTALGSTLHQQISVIAAARKLQHRTYQLLRVESALQELIEHYDSHRLAIPLRIHQSGNLRFVSGRSNPVMAAALRLRPNSSSDAITVVQLGIQNALTVIDRSSGVNRFSALACPRWSSVVNLDSIDSVLAISADGMTELSSVSHPHPGRPTCFDLNLEKGESMSVAGEFPNFATLLIPITQQYTLYVSNDGDLRYLRHVGARNIENQPLVRSISSLKIALETIPDSRLIDVTTILRLDDDYERSFHLTSRLSRLTHGDLLHLMR